MQNTEARKKLKKDALLQNLQIAVWGVLAIFLAVLCVLELLTAGSSAIGVGESVQVSSALVNVAEKRYTSTIRGSIANTGEDAVRIDEVRVTVSDGKERQDVVLEGFLLPPYFEVELYEEWQTDAAFNRVTRVAVVIDGVEDVLANATNALPVSGIAIFYLALLLVDVLLLVRAAKIRYYIYQETQMPMEGEGKC